eukprot:759570-Hanusia_phi.AAC.5
MPLQTIDKGGGVVLNSRLLWQLKGSAVIPCCVRSRWNGWKLLTLQMTIMCCSPFPEVPLQCSLNDDGKARCHRCFDGTDEDEG